MHKKSLFLLFCWAICAFGCTPKDNNPKDFSCILLYDENGQGLGIHGSCAQSNDWGHITLSAEERNLLNFSDTVSLGGTAAQSITYLQGYPNPIVVDHAMHLSVRAPVSGQAVKVKIAIVDETLKVLDQYALRIATNDNFAVQLHAGTYNTGQYYRVYYRVSVDGNENLFEGYGNILVCKTYIVNGLSIETDCM